jgi:hypothetical protein
MNIWYSTQFVQNEEIYSEGIDCCGKLEHTPVFKGSIVATAYKVDDFVTFNVNLDNTINILTGGIPGTVPVSFDLNHETGEFKIDWLDRKNTDKNKLVISYEYTPEYTDDDINSMYSFMKLYNRAKII